MIVCVLIPYFAAAVERQILSSPTALPLVITESARVPARVYAVSREAAQLGLRPGMSLRQAQALCPQARLVPANLSLYQQYCDELLTILTGFTDRLELEAIQPALNAYLDLGHLKSMDAIASGREIGRAVRTQTGLSPALGLASGKFPTWAAAAATSSNKALVVGPGQEAVFLAPRSINLLPLDEELTQRFQRLGLRTLGQFAALPAGAVLTQFGSYGRWLHQLARGQDDRRVLPRRSPPIEQATRQLDGPVCDWATLIALCRMMTAELANCLQDSGRLARLLHLSLELEDDTEWADQIVLRQPTSNSERLALNLEALLHRLQVTCGIVAVTITLADLLPAMGQQLELFGYSSGMEQVRQLNERLPDLIARYGANCFYQAAVTNPAAYLPESRFQLRAVAAI
ncbi:MAG: hypothetical protein BroJett011_08140 [Chloroflexota bacterium]|nr:MAG: hypothetical protein BroJett011_08140 [Chloroflexota bacterium]